MFWKIVTPLVVVLLFTWTAICFVPTFIFRFLLFNEKVFGFVAKYIWSPGILFLSFASVRVNGRKNIPKGENFIFTCNHESILDIPALFYASPTFLYFIAKKEYVQGNGSNPIITHNVRFIFALLLLWPVQGLHKPWNWP